MQRELCTDIDINELCEHLLYTQDHVDKMDCVILPKKTSIGGFYSEVIHWAGGFSKHVAEARHNGLCL